MTRDPTFEAAHGKWRGILASLCGQCDFLNGKNQPCPICGGTDRFQFTDYQGDGDYICRGCGPGKGFKLLMGLKGWDFRAAVNAVDGISGQLRVTATLRDGPRPKPRDGANDLNRLWKAAGAITRETAAGRYLMGRGLVLEPTVFNGGLRALEWLYHGPTRRRFPGMLGRFCAPDGKPWQLHRTYLSPQGSKASVAPNRMFTRGDLPKGGAIRLGVAAEEMGVAEGIETALAARQLYEMPVWAVTSTSMMVHWQPPPEAKRVVVFADNDVNGAGQAAAYTLMQRLAVAGLQVRVEVPRKDGADWNDMLTSASEMVS
jgi:putative DNA primase/helicase